jgi:cholesterol oxidase
MTPRLAMSLGELEPFYDAVVIGSGYAGGIAACRLARAGLRVCVLERGREWSAEQFPETLAEAGQAASVRGRTKGRKVSLGGRSALFELRVSDDLNALVGIGLGGTSLVNASVFLEPDARVWHDERWPRALREDHVGRAEAIARAREMMEPRAYPEHGASLLGKADLVRRAGARMGAKVERTPLMTWFGEERVTEAGVREKPCTACGDCVAGCRHESKRTVDRTYIADARARGAHVFCELGARTIRRAADGAWIVHLRPESTEIERDLPDPFVRARIVVVAAGVFGSAALLFRSRGRGLALSDALGSQVSGNGNRVLAAYDVAGGGSSQSGDARAPGPCISYAADLTKDDLEDGVTLEDAAIPSAIDALVAGATMADEVRRAPDAGVLGRIGQTLRAVTAAAAEHAVGASRPIQIVLVQAHDDASGRLSFDDELDDVVLSWPRFGESARSDVALAAIDAAARESGGRVHELRRPSALGALGAPHMTVHPLGGCPMGDDRDVGVVDHLGRVYDAAASDRTAVHDGLYVVDASVIPRSLGTNPVGTICTIAERALRHVVTCEHERERDQTAVGAPPSRAPERDIQSGVIGSSFSEAFSGWLTEHGRRGGNTDASGEMTPFAEPAELRLVITVDDLDAFLEDPWHPANAVGTLRCKLLGEEPVSIVRGKIALFSDDPVLERTYYELYDLVAIAPDGARYTISAMKTFRDGSPLRVYGDGTHLPFEVKRENGARLTGAMTMLPTSLFRTVLGVSTHGGPGAIAKSRAALRFRAFFARRWIERLLPGSRA